MPSIDKDQLKAVMHRDGPALVLAGPGSGKTTVLTHHIVYLTDRLKVSPSSILVITFTKAAAQSMESRYRLMCGAADNQVTFGTFHSVFFKLILKYTNRNLRIVNQVHKRKILESISGQSDDEDFLSGKISNYKSLINRETFLFLDEQEKKNFDDIFTEYDSYLKSNDFIDFDDILLIFRKMISENRGILEDIQGRYKYILVDEFQDINEIQYDILKRLSQKSKNIFAVGDEDQAIYAFRGSDVTLMKRFIDEYENVSVYELLSNYRCHAMIQEAASRVISQNNDRLKSRNVTAINTSSGNHLEIVSFEDENEQKEYVKKEYLKYISLKKKTVILTRTNKDRLFYEKVISGNQKYGEIHNHIMANVFSIVSDYVKFCLYGRLEDLANILNVPDRLISRSILAGYSGDLNSLIKSVKNMYKREKLTLFIRHIEMLKRMSPFSFTMYLCNIVSVKKYIVETYPEYSLSDIDAVIKDLLCISKSVQSLRAYEAALNNALESAYAAIAKEKNKGESEKCAVMTFHASKGLEFDVVIIPDLVEGKVPGRIALREMSMNEERRLFYVAMTRAKEKLLLTTLTKSGSSQLKPSRFLDNIR